MFKKIICVVGARPNFMKMAPLYAELMRSGKFCPIIVHTGQHYDYQMSKVFFEDLSLPEPHYSLESGSGTHAEQTASIMLSFERVILKEKPDLVVVFGDVNSTLACSIASKKISIPVAHVEAGLRSCDMSMPEEINRKITDSISDLLFTPSLDGNKWLLGEGVHPDKIHFVGNIMIDSLVKVLESISSDAEARLLNQHRLVKNKYALITLHRPSNVDEESSLRAIFSVLSEISAEIPVVFPMHPRTRGKMSLYGINPAGGGVLLLDPLGYRQFLMLMRNAQFVLTDSGGIQEETTFLNVPCLTLRKNTERPITISEGTNALVELPEIRDMVHKILSGKWKSGSKPAFWDGKTASRIVSVLSSQSL